VAKDNPVAPPPTDDPGVVPVLRNFDRDGMAATMRRGSCLWFKVAKVVISHRMPDHAGALTRAIDGEASIETIHQQLESAGVKLDWADFLGQFGALHRALNGHGRMRLRYYSSRRSPHGSLALRKVQEDRFETCDGVYLSHLLGSFRMKRSRCELVLENRGHLESYVCHLGQINGFIEFKIHPRLALIQEPDFPQKQ